MEFAWRIVPLLSLYPTPSRWHTSFAFCVAIVLEKRKGSLSIKWDGVLNRGAGQVGTWSRLFALLIEFFDERFDGPWYFSFRIFYFTLFLINWRSKDFNDTNLWLVIGRRDRFEKSVIPKGKLVKGEVTKRSAESKSRVPVCQREAKREWYSRFERSA